MLIMVHDTNTKGKRNICRDDEMNLIYKQSKEIGFIIDARLKT